MLKTKFEIGQHVFWATCNREATSMECPDCGGSARLRVTFHDDTTVSIDCQNCALGYDPPTGRIKIYNRTPKAQPVTITGLEVKGGGSVEYRADASYIIDEDRIFSSQEEALSKAAELAAEMDHEERERINKKEKDTRSWAWNATYHRREIKRAEQSLVYHKSKLAVANLKARPQATAKPKVARRVGPRDRPAG